MRPYRYLVNAYKHGQASILSDPTSDISSENEPDETRDIEADAIEDIANAIIRKAKGHGLAKIVDAI